MKNRESILREINKANGTLIMAGKLYREKFSSTMSEIAFAQAISRLCKSGEIERVSKGTYCKPRLSRFGAVPPSEHSIVNQFVSGSQGLVVGYTLFNKLGVTTQIGKRKTIYSSAIEERKKQIGNVVIQKYDLVYTAEIKSVICMMEILHKYKKIEDINYTEMLKCLKTLSNDYSEKAFDTVQKTVGYPKWTIAFLRELLNYYHVSNNLSKYLSELSNYPIPKMEELYEIARKQT